MSDRPELINRIDHKSCNHINAAKETSPTIVGTGLISLDAVILSDNGSTPTYRLAAPVEMYW